MRTQGPVTGQSPDARKQGDSRPARIRLLVARTELTQVEVAERLGVSVRALQRYCADATPLEQRAPFAVQYTLERLVAFQARVIGKREKRRERAALTPRSPRLDAPVTPTGDNQQV